MAFRKDRVKPTHYPRLPFHFIRSLQLSAALIVASIMAFFLKELAQDHYKLPWTFMLLFAVSLLTILGLTTTIVLHCCCGLNPVLNCILNSCLALLWSVSFSLLSWWSRGTITHVCNKNNWEDELGISICRLYKTLFSFALVGLVSTLCALVLDVRVQRNATKRGRFQPLQGGQADAKGLLDQDGHEMTPGYVSAQRNNGQRQQGGEGYGVPEAQSFLEDTGYHGAASRAR